MYRAQRCCGRRGEGVAWELGPLSQAIPTSAKQPWLHPPLPTLQSPQSRQPPPLPREACIHLDSFLDFASSTRKTLLLTSCPLNQAHPLGSSPMPHPLRSRRAPITQPIWIAPLLCSPGLCPLSATYDILLSVKNHEGPTFRMRLLGVVSFHPLSSPTSHCDTDCSHFPEWKPESE